MMRGSYQWLGGLLAAGLPGLLARRGLEGRAALVESFVRDAYRLLLEEELRLFAPEDLLSALVDFWSFADASPTGPRVRVFNPDRERNGWDGGRTVIEVYAPQMPFLLNTLRIALARAGLVPQVQLDMDLVLARAEDGHVQNLGDRHESGAQYQALVHIEVERQAEPALAEIAALMERTLACIQRVVQDHPAMLAAVAELAADLLGAIESDDRAGEATEAYAFLQWLQRGHFIFLGVRQYRWLKGHWHVVPDRALGLGHDKSVDFLDDMLAESAGHVLRFLRSPSRSPVHHDLFGDVIVIDRPVVTGRGLSQLRLFGLFSSRVQHQDPCSVPVLRQRVAELEQRAGFHRVSRDGRALDRLLRNFPSRELLVGKPEALLEGLLPLVRRQSLRDPAFFWRQDEIGRFVSLVAFLPKEVFSGELVERYVALLQERLHLSDLDSQVQVSDYLWVRLYIQMVRAADAPMPPLEEIEQRLRAMSVSWDMAFFEALGQTFVGSDAALLFARYRHLFSDVYKEAYRPSDAVMDVRELETLQDEGLRLALMEVRRDRGLARFKLYHLETPLRLSDVMPVLEHFGLSVVDERSFPVVEPRRTVWIHEFSVEVPAEVSREALETWLGQTFVACWRGELDDDEFNRLVLLLDRGPRWAMLLRAYARYAWQVRAGFTPKAAAMTLVRNLDITRALLAIFDARFDPALSAGVRLRHEAEGVHAVLALLEQVGTIEEDRILRRYVELIQATERTSFYVEQAIDRIALKLACQRISGLPKPVPLYEIFVHSPRVEAVHLRLGPVARGGLRWSDRPDDFRTEILGLVKAQQVKNALIVPVGSKGGFVIRRQARFTEPAALQGEAIACYRLFLSGLLDLTDNWVAGEVRHPPRVVCQDGDDPYLVVAADKGTASFSDHANAVSQAYGFWLDDAFASGGRHGYDHKVMGITARGAFICLRWHLRRLGLDADRDPFTMVGIGDMSGDVFGNGLLLSKRCRLLAAFDHRHVFIDPEPDPERAWQERQRLFQLPRSSWADYDSALISTGGGVWSRREKYIPLTPAMRALLGTEAARLTPDEVIRAVSQLPVDVIWNGGIGTYVKAATERDADVGDHANDAVRVNGAELRARVFCEGGNLGMTQRGRIEYSLAGGLCNTDFIDNAGGVNCSDHEVNLKIFLHPLVQAGELTVEARNQLLAELQEEVGALVLADNASSALSLSIAEHHAREREREYLDLIHYLQREAKLDIELEALPSTQVWRDRHREGRSVTRPELSVLIAYTKNHLKATLAVEGVADDPQVVRALFRAFPASMVARYGERLLSHPLRGALVATGLANGIVDHLGMTALLRLRDTRATLPDMARAYMAVAELFELGPVWAALREGQGDLAWPQRMALLDGLWRDSRRVMHWLLRQREHFLLDVARLHNEIRALLAQPRRWLPDAEVDQLEASGAGWAQLGVPPEAAGRLPYLPRLPQLMRVARLMSTTGQDMTDVARLHELLGRVLGLRRLRLHLEGLRVGNHWQAQARLRFMDRFEDRQEALALCLLKIVGAEVPQTEEAILARLMERVPEAIQSWQSYERRLAPEDLDDYTLYVTLLEELESVVRAVESANTGV